MDDLSILVKAMMIQLVSQARGPARPLAVATIEQLPQLLTLGLPTSMAIRETLLTAIHAARIRARHCVGSERYALDDFMKLCSEIVAKVELIA